MGQHRWVRPGPWPRTRGIDLNKRQMLFALVAGGMGLLLVACSAANAAPPAPTTQPTASSQGGSNRGGPNGGGNRQGPAPIFGTVASVSGDTMTVTTQQGTTNVKVTGAKIQQTLDGSASDLTAGEAVLIAGQQGSDGSFTANSIQIGNGNTAGLGGFQGQGPRQGQGQGQSQGQQGQSQRARPITGSVVSLQGDTLTVKSQQGDTTNVNITGARIQKTVDATAADLKAGETVVVMGQQGTDGTVSATGIQIRPAGAPAGGPGRGGSPRATPTPAGG